MSLKRMNDMRDSLPISDLDVREKYTKYFLSERGEVPWQYELLDKDEE